MTSSSPASLLETAWSAACKAIRANLIPGLLLQSVMAAMAIAYLFHPASHHAFESLAILRSQWGLFFSFLGTSFGSAILPELLRPILLGSSRARCDDRGLTSRLLFGIPFWGLIGMQVDLFYRLQYLLFGPSDSVAVIVKKVLVDTPSGLRPLVEGSWVYLSWVQRTCPYSLLCTESFSGSRGQLDGLDSSHLHHLFPSPCTRHPLLYRRSILLGDGTDDNFENTINGSHE